MKGHETLTETAAAILPADMPEFFRKAGKTLGHFSGDPDRWKNPGAKFLRAAEGANHYLDLEDLQGKDLPAHRYLAIDLMIALKKKPDRVGLLPYAIMENYEKLACAFYDHRKNPDEEHLRWKCIYVAGVLAHYTTDLSMPLHTTVNYDGIKEGKKYIQKGIHARIDAFPEKHGIKMEDLAKDLKMGEVAPAGVWDRVQEAIRESHRHVARCYELDKGGFMKEPNDVSRAFILERCRFGVQFTAQVWHAAWLLSKDLPPPY
ncbi:MAG: hypothetical protein EXR99_04270 [Gemmataceae bacterium]|nr:hypothetical protein [Gemmataceae bacterium]